MSERFAAEDSYLSYFAVEHRLRSMVPCCRKSILCYPELPKEWHVIHKMIYLLGYQVTNDYKGKFDLAINWEDTTVRSHYAELFGIARRLAVINLQCSDISKTRVDRVLREVFGYGLAVNPLSFDGLCVRKSEKNFAHDGRVIQCPVLFMEKGYVYQRVVDNTVEQSFVKDIRIPVIGDKIPFVYLKYRAIDQRFSAINTRVCVVGSRKVLTKMEQENIILFSRRMGLDYGELDAARDNKDGQLYIFDVNNTPSGPPNHISRWGYARALRSLSTAFEKSFGIRSRTKLI